MGLDRWQWYALIAMVILGLWDAFQAFIDLRVGRSAYALASAAVAVLLLGLAAGILVWELIKRRRQRR